MWFNKVIVGLDFTSIDTAVLKYTQFFADKLGFEMIYFIHVTEDLEEDTKLRAKFKDEMNTVEPWDEILLKKLKQSVNSNFVSEKDLEISYHILEGTPADKIIHWANVKDADLIIMGKKDVGNASGILAKKIARTSSHSMLFVTEDPEEEIGEILIPLDFSDNSMEALKVAESIRKRSGNCSLRLLHVYDVPAERYKILRSFEQIRQMFEDSAKETFVKFRKRMDLELTDYEIDFIQDDILNTAKQIYRYARNVQPDLLVIGAKGHSRLELLIVGSVTENLLLYYDYSPVLVIKHEAN